MKTGKAGGLYEEFFLGPNQHQYFIKPLEFDGDGAELNCDYTVRKLDDSLSSVTFNFTVESKLLIKTIDKVKLNDFEYDNLNKFYTEKRKNDYYTRYSAEMPYSDFIEFLKSEEAKIVITYDYLDLSFEETKSTKKKRKKLYEDLFELF